jgi:hypothetical protein
MHRTLRAAVAAAILVLPVAGIANAKGDAEAILDRALPTGVGPGDTLEISWSLVTMVDGTANPFDAVGVFVRTFDAKSGDPVEALARRDRPGHYVATLVVPSGGLGRFEIGVRGAACSGDTMTDCSRADRLFHIAAKPASAAAPAAPAASAPAASAPPAPAQGSFSGAPAAPGIEPALGPLGIAGAGAAAVILLRRMVPRRRPGSI